MTRKDRPSGKWTYLSGSIGSYMTISCPFCGETFDDVAEWKYNFCPNCGADMRGNRNNLIRRDDAIDAIEALQIEIIRCKECKYYSVEGETTRFSWCNALEIPTDEMRYCSDGERGR